MATAKEIDRHAVRVLAEALKTGQPKVLETSEGSYTIADFRGMFFWQLPPAARRAFRAVAARQLEHRKEEKRK